MDEVGLLSRMAVALAIGLLVGLERGWKLREAAAGARAAGLRTFALSGLLGGVAGLVAQITTPWVVGFALLAHALAFIAFHLMEARTDSDVSATGTVAGILTFLLGTYAVLGEVRVAVAVAVAMTMLLALRDPLHRWLRDLKWEEIRAVLVLLAMSFLLLPVLPNRTVDPWEAVNPTEIWMLAILIAAISFGGYVAIRLFGDRLGIILAALAGGLASSTATTLTLARFGRTHPGMEPLLSAGILVAGCVMVVRVALLAILLNPTLAGALAVPAAVMTLVMVVASLVLLFLWGRSGQGQQATLAPSNPLELATALKLAAFIAIVMLAAGAAKTYIGEQAVLGVAAISGIADVDAVTISMARLGGSAIGLQTALTAIGIAVGVNTISKAIMAGTVGGIRIARQVGLASVLALAAGGLALTFGP
ncbi:MgtC/SapB family protein [Niveispirillum irakense]|uniref:MgtC/SapB family protein n=1 Tax=Niveispirillum irakense TaxID=34011 RepID=UPI0004045111|nr:DUF4010 domain-containing protein [Niveispirillum irakense]